MWLTKTFLLLFLLSPTINAVVITCSFSTSTCTISAGAVTTKSDVTVTSVVGTYPANTNGSFITFVDGQYVYYHFFPRGLTKFFPNINSVKFTQGLREIRKEDLQEFSTKLTFLNLGYNAIEIIERNLFIFNPNLQTLYLNNNSLKYIDPQVFDNLSNLSNLSVDYNYCIAGLQSNRAGVLALIQDIKFYCAIGGDEKTRAILDLQEKITSIGAKNAALAKSCAGVSFGDGSSVARIF